MRRNPDERFTGQNIVPVYVPKNLLEVDVGGETFYSGKVNETLERAKEEGYDGVKFLNLDDAIGMVNRPATHIAVFDPAKIRSKFAPKAGVQQDKISGQLLLDPYEERNRRGEDIRQRINDLLYGDPYIQDDPSLVLGLHRDLGKDINVEMTKTVDPEGRELLSRFQVGLEGKGGMTNEEMLQLMPFLVRAFMLVSGSPNESTLGRYISRAGYDEYSEVDNEIELLDVGQNTAIGPATPQMFFDTFVHELGHAVEAQSDLREFMGNLSYVDTIYDAPPRVQNEIRKQAIELSSMRRQAVWTALMTSLDSLASRTSLEVPTISTLHQYSQEDLLMLGEEIRQDLEASGEIVAAAGFDLKYQQLTSNIRYLTSAPELAADMIAMYMQNPDYMKKNFPDAAKLVRMAVNDSNISHYITFHSIAGLLGATAAGQILMGLARGDDEEQEGALTLGRGALAA